MKTASMTIATKVLNNVDATKEQTVQTSGP